MMRQEPTRAQATRSNQTLKPCLTLPIVLPVAGRTDEATPTPDWDCSVAPGIEREVGRERWAVKRAMKSPVRTPATKDVISGGAVLLLISDDRTRT